MISISRPVGIVTCAAISIRSKLARRAVEDRRQALPERCSSAGAAGSSLRAATGPRPIIFSRRLIALPSARLLDVPADQRRSTASTHGAEDADQDERSDPGRRSCFELRVGRNRSADRLMPCAMTCRGSAAGCRSPRTGPGPCPSASTPVCRKRKISCIVTTSPSMPVSSDRLISLRRPSARRPTWMTTLIAEAIWARADRAGMSMPLMPIICSTRDKRIARRVGVDRGHRAVVAGVHRLQHVERLAGANLADDDPVGPHAQRVLDQVALGDLALALDVRRAGFQPDDVLLLELELGRILDRDDALAVVDEGRHGVEHGRLARAGAAGDQHVAARRRRPPSGLRRPAPGRCRSRSAGPC